MKDLAWLENGPPSTFTFFHKGAAYALPDPRLMRHADVLAGLQCPADLVPANVALMPLWKVHQLVDAWAAAYGLGDTAAAVRLAELLSRYGESIEADLALKGWDLTELWRARRWRFVLNLVDHLPRDSA